MRNLRNSTSIAASRNRVILHKKLKNIAQIGSRIRVYICGFTLVLRLTNQFDKNYYRFSND
jgi:hypothetical protein